LVCYFLLGYSKLQIGENSWHKLFKNSIAKLSNF
jgi:hypothetical protein